MGLYILDTPGFCSTRGINNNIATDWIFDEFNHKKQLKRNKICINNNNEEIGYYQRHYYPDFYQQQNYQIQDDRISYRSDNFNHYNLVQSCHNDDPFYERVGFGVPNYQLETRNQRWKSPYECSKYFIMNDLCYQICSFPPLRILIKQDRDDKNKMQIVKLILYNQMNLQQLQKLMNNQIKRYIETLQKISAIVWLHHKVEIIEVLLLRKDFGFQLIILFSNQKHLTINYE